MCEVVKIEKKMLYRKFRFVYRTNLSDHIFIRFHKENEKGKEKEGISRRGYTKIVVP